MLKITLIEILDFNDTIAFFLKKLKSCVYWPNQIGQKTAYETDEAKYSVEILSKEANIENSSPLLIEQKFKLTETKVVFFLEYFFILKSFLFLNFFACRLNLAKSEKLSLSISSTMNRGLSLKCLLVPRDSGT